MKNIGVTVLLLACMALASNTYAVGQNEAAETTTQILHAFKAENWAKIAEYCTGNNRELFQDLAAKSERGEPLILPGDGTSVTSGWRWQVATNWNGEISEVRYSTDIENDGLASYWAYAKFGESDNGCFVVTLFKENKWCYANILLLDHSEFNSYSLTSEMVDSTVTEGSGLTSEPEYVEVELAESGSISAPEYVDEESAQEQELYEQYKEAYDNLTALMEAGKKDTPEGQAAYAEYKRCKALCPSPPK